MTLTNSKMELDVEQLLREQKSNSALQKLENKQGENSATFKAPKQGGGLGSLTGQSLQPKIGRPANISGSKPGFQPS